MDLGPWPYYICFYIFALSFTYPLHQISTFPLNIISVLGPLFSKSQEIGNYMTHLLPLLWVPWEISVSSVILYFVVFFIYTISMIIFFKNPLDYYEHSGLISETYLPHYKNIILFIGVFSLYTGYMVVFLKK